MFYDMTWLERILFLKRIKGSGNPMHEATSTSGSFVTDVVAPLKSLKVTLEPIQSGSGTPSPDNIRPISGHTEVVTEVCGVNVWDEEWEVGSIGGSGETITDNTRIRSKNFIPILPNTSYRIICSSRDGRIAFYDANKANISVSYSAGPWISGFTTPANAYYMKFSPTSVYGTTYNHDISINYPSTDHEYHAHDGHTYTTDLGRTVYGGTLDVVSGELVVDRAMVAPTSVSGVTQHSSGTWYCTIRLNDTASADDALMSNMFVRGYLTDGVGACYTTASGAILVIVLPQDVTTIADADAWLEANQPTFVYRLATPQTYQLDPQQVDTLIGQNNIITGNGVEVSEIVYMTRLVGSPLLGGSVPTPDSGDESEESNEESQEVGEDG